MTEWAPGPVSQGAQPARRCGGSSRATGSRAPTLRLVDHHEAHAAAAAWASGFASCAVLTIDGLGDGAVGDDLRGSATAGCERVAVVAGAALARRVLRARHEPAQHARARGRGQGHGARRLRGADCRRRQPAAGVGARAGRRHRDAVARTCLAPAAGARPLAVSPTSSSPTSRSGPSRMRAMALARDAVRLTGLRQARAGWRRRVERQGDAAGAAPARRSRRSYVFPHMGDGGLALGAAVVAAAAAAASRCARSQSARPRPGVTIGRRSSRALRAAGLPATSPANACRAVSRTCWPTAGSSCGSRARWSTARARSGTAACWRGPIGSTCAIASIWRSSGASGTSRSARACSRARRARLLADWTGGRNRCDDDGVPGGRGVPRAIWPA